MGMSQGEQDIEKLRKLRTEYERLCHAMQTGVAISMQMEPGSTEPKHLRCGINSAMVNDAAITDLLIEKGIITREEHLECLNKWMKREVENYKNQLEKFYGRKFELA